MIHLRNRDYEPQTGTFLTRDPLDGDNDPLNKVDPLGLRADDCTMASGLCVIDDLGGAFGTANDQVKPGAGRIKSDHGDFLRQAGCILNQNRRLIYSVHDYTDEIYMAAIHAQIETRLVCAIFAKESESFLEPVKDASSSIGLDSDASAIGPSNKTVGGALFDRIFTGRSYVSHGNKEFVPVPGSLTNAATHYMCDAWDYYCGSGGCFLC